MRFLGLRIRCTAHPIEIAHTGRRHCTESANHQSSPSPVVSRRSSLYMAMQPGALRPGPQPARPGPVTDGPGPARPDAPGRAWATTPARGTVPARPVARCRHGPAKEAARPGGHLLYKPPRALLTLTLTLPHSTAPCRAALIRLRPLVSPRSPTLLSLSRTLGVSSIHRDRRRPLLLHGSTSSARRRPAAGRSSTPALLPPSLLPPFPSTPLYFSGEACEFVCIFHAPPPLAVFGCVLYFSNASSPAPAPGSGRTGHPNPNPNFISLGVV